MDFYRDHYEPFLDGRQSNQAKRGSKKAGASVAPKITPAAPAQPLPSDAARQGQVLSGIRVLLVDDDADIREAFQLALQHYGAEVTTVSSVAEAIAALERSPPDVLLSDLSMPDASGYDLIQKVAVLKNTLPAAAITALGSVKERERALTAGFRMHLSKPIKVEALVSAVADLAGRPLGKNWSAGPTPA